MAASRAGEFSAASRTSGAGTAGLAKQGIGQNLLDFADGVFAFALHEVARIDAIDIGQPDQHLDRDRPLVALHEVEIARRNIELGGHAGLGQLTFPAKPLKARAGENLPWNYGCGIHEC